MQQTIFYSWKKGFSFMILIAIAEKKTFSNEEFMKEMFQIIYIGGFWKDKNIFANMQSS